MSDLFRPEAVDYQQQKLLGTIVLRQTWPMQWLTLFFGALVIGLLCVFFLFGFARRETLAGLLLPGGGLVQATSPQAGLVQEVRAREGDAVNAGDVLFVLSGEREGERGATRQRIGSALDAQRTLLDQQIATVQRQAEMDRAALLRKRGQMDAQIDQLRAGIELQRRRAALAADAAQRFGSPENALVVSREKLDEKRSDAIDQEVRLHAMQREQAALQAERGAVQDELNALPERSGRELATLRGSLGGIAQAEAENDTLRRWEVRAPRAGRVTVVAVEPGRSIDAGAVLASVAPEDAPLEAVLYAPSRAAGQLRIGMPAQVRFDALPYQKYGQFAGEVREVSRSPVPAAEAAGLLTGSAAGTPLYRVRVQLKPGAGERQLRPELATALKAGMQLEATLTLEHRRFYEWVLEPLLGVKARLS